MTDNVLHEFMITISHLYDSDDMYQLGASNTRLLSHDTRLTHSLVMECSRAGEASADSPPSNEVLTHLPYRDKCFHAIPLP